MDPVDSTLIRERDLLRLVLDNSADQIYIKDTQGRFLMVNDLVVRALGAQTREELIGKTDFDYQPRELAERYSRDEQALFASGKPLVNHEEPIFDHETGEERWLSSNKIPYRDSEDRIVGLVGINRDITALRQSMKALEITQKQLAQSERVAALGGMVVGMAHEMNTPVGISITAISFLEESVIEFVRSYQDGVLHRSDLDTFIAKVQESSELIHRNLETVVQEIRDFKEIAVDQSGGDESQTLELGAYLNEIALSLRSRLTEGGHEMQISCPAHLTIRQFPRAILQILTNLTVNSLKHGFPEGTSGLISISVQEDAGEVVLVFTDNGQGIEPEIQQHLFEPFFTTKRGHGGTGLGLTIVHNLVTHRMGGSISYSSNPGSGAEFRVRFPREI